MKQNLTLCLVMATAILISCSTSKNAGDNNLSKEEKEQGYKLLFDGKTMNGWRTYQNKSAESWSVDSGTLHCKGSSANYGAITADLMTKDQYENFDLSVDWKISPKGNSGILYMVTEDNAYSYLSGPEYQIIDDKNFPGNWKTGKTQRLIMQWILHPPLFPIRQANGITHASL